MALETLQRAIEMKPDEMDILTDIARLYLDNGQALDPDRIILGLIKVIARRTDQNVVGLLSERPD